MTPSVQADRVRTRRAMTAPLVCEEDEANREISRIVFALPRHLEREIDGHFYLGGGTASLLALRDAIARARAAAERN